MQITVEDHPHADDVTAVRAGLSAFNLAHTGQPDANTPLVITVRGDDGTLRGGLLGDTYWGWLYVQILWLDESVRGQGIGSRLMQMAEQIAVERGCHAAHLDTMDFQAPDFYRKLGYSVFGRLDDLPTGHSRLFLQKSLVPRSSGAR
jgi:GNAT superfamily N-acetyltransferase